jgi:hypothetical protein
MWFQKSKYVGDDETVIEELESATSEMYSELNFNRKVDKWYDIIINIDTWENTKYYKYPHEDSTTKYQFIRDTQLKLKMIETILNHKNEQDSKNRSFVIEKYES